MSLTRNQQNYIIMSVIYIELNDFNYGERGNYRAAKDLMEEMVKENGENHVPLFIEDMVNLSLMNYQEIVNAFSLHLKDWKWERLPLLTQAILLMSYTHFYKIEKIAKAIVIDVAVKLAKEYIEEKQAKFINAILDEILI